MLARSLRLRLPRHINSVYQRGRYGASGDLQVKLLKNHLQQNRAAIVVSRKVSKKATVRNASRRKVSGALERLWASLPEGYDMVITVRREVDKESAEKLTADLQKALSQATGIKTERK